MYVYLYNLTLWKAIIVLRAVKNNNFKWQYLIMEINSTHHVHKYIHGLYILNL